MTAAGLRVGVGAGVMRPDEKTWTPPPDDTGVWVGSAESPPAVQAAIPIPSGQSNVVFKRFKNNMVI
jgi:hypothetical protein